MNFFFITSGPGFVKKGISMPVNHFFFWLATLKKLNTEMRIIAQYVISYDDSFV